MDELDEIMEIVDGEPQMTDGNTSEPEEVEEEYDECDESEKSDEAPKQKLGWLREIISVLLHFCCLMAMDIYFRAIFEKNNTADAPFLPTVIASAFWCLIIVAISLFMPRWLRRIYVVLTTLACAVLVAANAIMDSFFGQYLSFSSIMFADDGAKYFEWEYFDIPVDLVIILVLCVVLSVTAAIILPKTKKLLRRLIVTLALVVAGGVGAGVTSAKYFADDFGGITWDSTKSRADYYEEFTDYRYCMHLCGFYHYTFRDIYISTGLRDSAELFFNRSRVEELDSYYAEKAIDPDNEMTGALKGKSLLLIQMESIDSWMVNDVAMPTLNSLREKSIEFTNFFAPKYLWAATFSSENAVNTGVLTPMNSSKMSYFTDTEYPFSLPNLFKAEGYTVNSFHRSGKTMYNRGEIHQSWGYERYYGAGDFGINGDMDSEMLKAYDNFVPEGQFMSFFITYTGHGPYTADGEAVKKYEDIIRPQLTAEAEDEYIWALCHAYETDMFIKNLLEKLEADGRLDDTAIIFYTDHYDHYVTGDGILEKYKGTDDTNLMGNVPCLIYSADLEAAKVDKVVATYDLTPTIVNLFDLDCDGRYYLGNDAFSDNGGYVIFRDMSWYDGETYYNIKKDKPTERSKERNKEITQRLNASWDSVKFNYFKDKK